jgi:translation initiation factor IF-1
LSGKMRQAWVRVVPGDDVELEFSGYSLDRARISFRGVRQHPRGAT